MEEKQSCPPMQVDLQDAIGGMYAPLSRTRYLELAALSKQLVELAVKMGVRPQEGCTMQELVRTLWRLA